MRKYWSRQERLQGVCPSGHPVWRTPSTIHDHSAFYCGSWLPLQNFHPSQWLTRALDAPKLGSCSTSPGSCIYEVLHSQLCIFLRREQHLYFMQVLLLFSFSDAQSCVAYHCSVYGSAWWENGIDSRGWLERFSSLAVRSKEVCMLVFSITSYSKSRNRRDDACISARSVAHNLLPEVGKLQKRVLFRESMRHRDTSPN